MGVGNLLEPRFQSKTAPWWAFWPRQIVLSFEILTLRPQRRERPARLSGCRIKGPSGCSDPIHAILSGCGTHMEQIGSVLDLFWCCCGSDAFWGGLGML